MLRPEPKRAFYGYLAGAGLAVFVLSTFAGPLFPFGLVIGIGIALVCGILVVIPAYAALSAVSQLRPWWAVLLGYALLVLPPALLAVPGDFWISLILLKRDLQGEVVLDGARFLAGATGAAGGLLGWIVAFGFRLRPESAAQDVLEVFD